MSFEEKIILVFIVSFICFLIMMRMQRKKEKTAELYYNSIMDSLEEKSKKAGTFKVSYKDTKNIDK